MGRIAVAQRSSDQRPPGHFERPYFVTPHAVRRFQQRIADVSRADAIRAVQALLQEPGLPVDAQVRDGKLCVLYRIERAGVLMHFGVTHDPAREWPTVTTVFGRHKRTFKHWKRLERREAYKRKHGHYPYHIRWTQQEQEVLEALRVQGYTLKQCEQIMHRSDNTIARHAPKIKPYYPPWTEEQITLCLRLRARGVPCKEIGRRLGKSREAVNCWLCRYRRKQLKDPQKRRTLELIRLAPPNQVGKALRIIRKEGLHRCPR